MDRIKKYVAEIIGTFVLVTFGCGTAVAVGCNAESGSGYLITAFAFGLVIVAMAYSIGNVSGCHINPAVSLAMFIRRQIDGMDCICYMIAQCIGSLGGCLVLLCAFGKDCGFGANQVQDTWTNGGPGKAFIVEIILTFVFVIAVIGVTSKVQNGAIAGVVIGLTLTLVHIFGIALTGTSVNPARSLMPALFARGAALHQLWIFIVGPLIGGALAAIVYSYLEIPEKKAAKAK
ncbi:MAG: MIP family channel protein [Lachnospiraceae bacterium]|nr:MIP family channel protein [Lachnospiraceae bacterium]